MYICQHEMQDLQTPGDDGGMHHASRRLAIALSRSATLSASICAAAMSRSSVSASVMLGKVVAP